MTVIEHEAPTAVPEAPTAVPVTEDIVILRTVRDRFRSGEWEWIQGQAHDGFVGYCLVGGIRTAAGEEISGDWTNTTMRVVFRLQDKLHVGRLAGWNDDHTRSFSDILVLLDEAIRELERREG